MKNKGYSEKARELGVSRQRIHQLALQKKRRCPTCGKPVVRNKYRTTKKYSTYCEEHRIKHCERGTRYYYKMKEK